MKQSLNISSTESLLKASMERLLKAYGLASEFGIKIFDGKFDVSCPAIENSLKTIKVKASWVKSEPNTVEAHLFTQFEKALSAVEYAKEIAQYGTYKGGSYSENKRLYTELNVYGRAMFIYIVNKMEWSNKPAIFLSLANYPEESLNFNTYGYDQSTKVAKIYKTHIAPTINPWVEGRLYTIKSFMEDSTRAEAVGMVKNEDHKSQNSDQELELTEEINGALIPMTGDTVFHTD
jgi:hypothetical protein